MHHAHHRGDNPKGGQAIAHLLDCDSGNSALVVMGVYLVVHQVFDFHGIEVSTHHQAQIIGKELDQVVIGEQVRKLREQSALLGCLDVALDRHQSLLADLVEHAIEQPHQRHVARLAVFGTLQNAGQGLQRGLEHFCGVSNQECSDGSAADHQHFDGLHQPRHVAPRKGEAAKHGADNDKVSDDD